MNRGRCDADMGQEPSCAAVANRRYHCIQRDSIDARIGWACAFLRAGIRDGVCYARGRAERSLDTERRSA
jgi:hypothetical protein